MEGAEQRSTGAAAGESLSLGKVAGEEWGRRSVSLPPCTPGTRFQFEVAECSPRHRLCEGFTVIRLRAWPGVPHEGCGVGSCLFCRRCWRAHSPGFCRGDSPCALCPGSCWLCASWTHFPSRVRSLLRRSGSPFSSRDSFIRFSSVVVRAGSPEKWGGVLLDGSDGSSCWRTLSGPDLRSLDPCGNGMGSICTWQAPAPGLS
nr:uncharacterized protein LOC104651684 [Saimiri boliviensis boliviensis]